VPLPTVVVLARSAAITGLQMEAMVKYLKPWTLCGKHCVGPE
jgi:hypothetical protein